MSSALNRREFIGLSGAGLLSSGGRGAALAGAVVPDSQEPRTKEAHRAMLAQRRNIIIFMPDEMRADSLACYGNPVTRTPNFDRMAREGARFDQCHVQFPVWRLTQRHVDRLADECARPPQPLLLPAAGGAEHIPLPAPCGLRCLLVRQE